MNVRRLSIAVLLTAVVLPVTRAAAADQVIFLVRHAERAPSTPAPPGAHPPGAGMMGEDPPLSAAGEQRAARLATMLAPANIKSIFTTEYRRTRQTAAPLAQKLGLTPVMAAARDPDPLVAQVGKLKTNVLIVGHSNTLPDLMKKLGVTTEVKIGDDDFDDLFVVVRPAAGEPTLIRLKY
jgi:broad specificity phosphatase PhoE